jgi:hypothetical protein
MYGVPFDALESFAGDRRAAALGDVEEAPAQMRPTEGERDRLAAGGIGNGLVGDVAVALHDPAIVLEQLERVDRAATGSVAVGDGRRVGAAPGPVVAGDGPEVSFLGAAAAGTRPTTTRRIRRQKTGPASLRSLRPASCTASIRKPTSPTCSPSSSICGLPRASTNSCPGSGRPSSRPTNSRRNSNSGQKIKQSQLWDCKTAYR